MKTKESEEMYLETILLLKKKKSEVRSVDVTEELHYAKSSVSRGVNLLRKNGYIVMDKSGFITLTPLGDKKAAQIYERHRLITKALMKMGADKELAESNACRIEHVITPEMFNIVKTFAEK